MDPEASVAGCLLGWAGGKHGRRSLGHVGTVRCVLLVSGGRGAARGGGGGDRGDSGVLCLYRRGYALGMADTARSEPPGTGVEISHLSCLLKGQVTAPDGR